MDWVKFKTRWVFWFFSLFQKDLELFDENYGYEMAWGWLYSKTKAEDFALDGSFSGSTVFSNIYFIRH